jgi:spore maturation protein CgeB
MEETTPMRIVMFCHSVISDWNNGNAHFLRGVVGEFQRRGHDVHVYEPRDAWSMTNLLRETGPPGVTGVRRAYPTLPALQYDLASLDLDEVLDGAAMVVVHEWNEPQLVAAIGRHRARGGKYVLFFHDTHHRTATDPSALRAFDLAYYDGVLAFGDVVRERYAAWGWGRRAWTWHEAADVRVFTPVATIAPDSDVIWIGNWGDGERSAEIREYLVNPVTALGLRARVYGVRYPAHARHELQQARIEYLGWLPNYCAPAAFARHRVTVHIPRRPYVEALPGIPTIRVFEALACGIPLVSAYWADCEGLFTAGRDYLVARNPEEMQCQLRTLLADPELAREVSAQGLRTIHQRHTCGHRVEELLGILDLVRGTPANAGALL